MARKKAAAKSTQTPVQVFISYSNRDRELLDKLVKHLQPLVDQGLLSLSYDRALKAGSDWSRELPRLLLEAPIVLFLVSPDSLSSAFVSREWELALSQQEKKWIVPILLRPCNWHDSSLARYVALPTGAKPVTTWENRDEAFLDIARGLQRVVESARQTSDRGDLSAKHKGQINRIAITPGGRLAVSSGEDGTAIVWDANTLQPLALAGVLAENAGITDVQVSPDGKLAATSSRDKTIKVWDLESRRKILTLEGHTHVVNTVSFTEDGERLLSGSDDSTLRLWEIETGRCLWTINSGQPADRVIAIPGRGLAASTHRTELSIWDLQMGEKVRSSPLSESVTGLSGTPDGVRFITCDVHGFAVWEIDSGKIILRCDTGFSTAIAAHPNGRHVVVALLHGLQLWDLSSGTFVREVTLGNERPTALAITPDARRAIWGSEQGGIFAWPIDVSVARALPVGRERLWLAYLATLESPELWRVLETWDESALSGIGAQLGISPEQNVLEVLRGRHPDASPPALWAAWMETLHRSKLGKTPDVS